MLQTCTRRGESASRVLAGHGVFVNVLCVLSAANSRKPDEVYQFLRELGAEHAQFLPLVTSASMSGVSPLAAPPEAIATFLCRVFDIWIREDVGRIVIRSIDEALRPIYGLPHALCVHRDTCGDVAVLERDGLPATCLECEVLTSCNGGCPKDRAPDGLNYLRPAYKRFFTHTRPELERLAAHMRAGKPLRSFRAMDADDAPAS